MRRWRRPLTALTFVGAVAAGTTGWAWADAQTAVTGLPAGVAMWQTDRSPGRALPDPATATPAEVARFFAGLSGAEQRRLAERHPAVVGNLDGAPIALR